MKNAVAKTILQRLEFFIFLSYCNDNKLLTNYTWLLKGLKPTCRVEVSFYFLLISVLPVTMDQNDKILDMSLGVVFCPVFFFFF